MGRYRINTVPREIELKLARWAAAGYHHPKTEQYKHGGYLNQLNGGRYSADLIGFILVGRFSDPAVAFQRYHEVGGRFWELLDLTEDQAEPLVNLSSVQDCCDVGTETIIHELFNEQHFQTHTCEESEWRLNGNYLNAGAAIVLPVSGQAREWLALASISRNRELRNVRVNDLETGSEDREEMQLCINSKDEPAIFVAHQKVEQKALDERLWWLTQMLNHFMLSRIVEIKQRRG